MSELPDFEKINVERTGFGFVIERPRPSGHTETIKLTKTEMEKLAEHTR